MPMDPDIISNDQAVKYIPYRPQSALAADNDDAEETILTLSESSCQKSWKECLSRISTAVDNLDAKVVSNVCADVRSTESLLGLPYPELPTVCLTGPRLLDAVAAELDTEADLSHIYPANTSNLPTLLKAIITSFTGPSPSSSSSLAAYDITRLRLWYANQRVERLVVVLHEFEKLDPETIQNLFAICATQLPALPLVFILVLNGPPEFLHLAYPRKTLALLRISSHVASGGASLLHQVLLNTFFNLNFEPALILGPPTLEFVADYFTRHDSSPDAICNIIQIVHLKHYTTPLAVFAHDSLLGEETPDDAANLLSSEAFENLKISLQARLSLSPQNFKSGVKAASAVLTSVTSARNRLRTRARQQRAALRVAVVLHDILKHGRPNLPDPVTLMVAAVRGRLYRAAAPLVSSMSKLSPVEISKFLSDLHAMLHNAPEHVRREEERARTRIVTLLSLADSRSPDAPKAVASWVSDYLEERSQPLDEFPLWDVWYTGTTIVPSELINPSVRGAIVGALLRPLDYGRGPERAYTVGLHASSSVPSTKKSKGKEPARETKEQAQPPALWQLPDTSILFARYLDSGRFVNVYDWFESFALVLDEQKKHLGPSQGESVEEMEEDDEELEARWQREVQARFMRALHELDYVGMIKHTKRKPDHIIRTVLDVPD